MIQLPTCNIVQIKGVLTAVDHRVTNRQHSTKTTYLQSADFGQVYIECCGVQFFKCSTLLYPELIVQQHNIRNTVNIS